MHRHRCLGSSRNCGRQPICDGGSKPGCLSQTKLPKAARYLSTFPCSIAWVKARLFLCIRFISRTLQFKQASFDMHIDSDSAPQTPSPDLSHLLTF